MVRTKEEKEEVHQKEENEVMPRVMTFKVEAHQGSDG